MPLEQNNSALRAFNGLTLIEQLQIQDKAILVTSRYEEPSIQQRCATLGVRLIPKGLAGFVPIVQSPSPPPSPTRGEGEFISSPLMGEGEGGGDFLPLDYVLIDDDPIIPQVWALQSRRAKKKIKTFDCPDAFFSVAHEIPKETPIYVDSDLGDGIKGEEVSKLIHEMGFENIFLATGYRPDEFGELP